MNSKKFVDAVSKYTCWTCGEDVPVGDLARSTRREARHRSRSIGSLDPEHIQCRECEVEETDLESGDLFGGYTSEVWKWNFSGLSLTQAQKTVIALNY